MHSVTTQVVVKTGALFKEKAMFPVIPDSYGFVITFYVSSSAWRSLICDNDFFLSFLCPEGLVPCTASPTKVHIWPFQRCKYFLGHVSNLYKDAEVETPSKGIKQQTFIELLK